MAIILTVLAVFAVLVLNELWWRKRQPHDEFSRKFVHITVGSFVAFWPYFLSPDQIKLLSVAFIVVVGISKYLHVFRAIHSVQRPTWGELLFAVTVGLLAFVGHHPHIYTVALLEMSLADGLAAVVGTRFGNSNRYTIMGYPKSIVGTVTFFAISLALLIGYSLFTPGFGWSPLIIAIPIAATLLENLAVHGFDNLIVPLFVGAVLLFYP